MTSIDELMKHKEGLQDMQKQLDESITKLSQDKQNIVVELSKIDSEISNINSQAHEIEMLKGEFKNLEARRDELELVLQRIPEVNELNDVLNRIEYVKEKLNTME